MTRLDILVDIGGYNTHIHTIPYKCMPCHTMPQHDFSVGRSHLRSHRLSGLYSSNSPPSASTGAVDHGLWRHGGWFHEEFQHGADTKYKHSDP